MKVNCLIFLTVVVKIKIKLYAFFYFECCQKITLFAQLVIWDANFFPSFIKSRACIQFQTSDEEANLSD